MSSRFDRAFGRDADRASSADGRRRARTSVRRGLDAVTSSVRRTVARPTSSDVVTIAVTLALALVIGSALVGGGLAVLATVAGVASAVVTACLASRRPAVRILGGMLAVPVALVVAVPSTLAFAFGVGLAGSGAFAAVTLWALVYAGFAATLVSWEPMGDGGVRRGARGTLLAATGIVGVVVLRVAPDAGVRDRAGEAAADFAASLHGTAIAADGSWASLSFFVLAICACVLVGRALAALPLERLLPPDRRGEFATVVDRVRRGLSIAVRVAAVGALATVVAPAVLDARDVPATPTWLRTELPAPVGEAIATLVTASGLRLALVALALAAVGVLLAEWLRRALRRGLATTLARLFAPAVGGALVALVLARALAEPAVDANLGATLEGLLPAGLAELVGSFPAFALAAVVLVLAMSSLSSTLYTVTWLRVFRILPPRAIGASLAACSVFVLAIGLAVVGRAEPAIWTGAAAFVVWDLGEYGDSLRVELGTEASTLRAELVHAGSSLLTAGLVAGATVALYRWVAADVTVVDQQLALIAVGAGVLTVALVSWVLRG